MLDVFVIGGANLDIKAKTVFAHVAGTSNPAIINSKPGGVARNIAHNLARLGVKVALQTVVGDDASGNEIVAATAKAGCDVASVNRVKMATGTYLAILDDKGELATAVNDMRCLEALTIDMLDWPRILKSRFVVADCNLSVEVLHALAARCADKLIVEPVSVSKCQKLLAVLRTHSIFAATPNLDQVHALVASRDVNSGVALLHKLGLQNVVIHAGAEGAYASDGETITHIASQAAHIIDVTGAGDAATAGLIYGLLQKAPLAKAALIGQALAGKVIASQFSTLD